MVLNQYLDQYVTNPYLRAAIIAFVLLIALTLIVFIFSKLFQLVSRKRSLSNSPIKRLAVPLIIIAFLIIIRFSLYEIASEWPGFEATLRITLYSLVIILIGYLGFVLLDILIFGWWRKLAQKTKSKIDDNLISIIHGILQTSLIVLAIVFILNLWGIEVTPILAGLGIAGIAVALALQPTLNNIIAGISLILDKSIREEDVIYLDEKTEGRVEKIGLRSTKIITSNDEIIIVPNNKLAESRIENISLPEPKTRIVIPFSVAYGSDIEKVKKIVIKEITTIKNAYASPKPFVRFMKMGDSSLNFEAYFYIHMTSLANRDNSIDEANTKIYNSLNDAGIRIPFPQMDVHLKK
ncbi:mechanosensitive ion channel family protein [Candidatus Pacearchaeota archaeon]|nr:mechanosensitive ion channel family protein [Candidatus Pacearchaeota archaeon]